MAMWVGAHGTIMAYTVDNRNEEGSDLLEMAQGLDLAIVNMCFKNKEEHLITYRSGPHASQIDFIVIRQKDRKYVQD